MRYHRSMARERLPGASVLGLVVLVVSAALVITRYGWYSAFDAVVPLASAFLWLSVLAVSCWGAGRLVCGRWMSVTRWTTEDVVLVLLAGTAVLMAASGLLAILHILYPPLLLLVLAGCACVGALDLYRRPSTLPEWDGSSSKIWWLAIGIAGGLSLAAATTFAPFYDQWHYHLGFPYQWLRHGTIVAFSRHAYSFFPSNMGLLYLYPLAGPGGWAAQGVHWWMGLLTAGGVAAVAHRLGAGQYGRVLAVALFVTTPSAVQLAALAGADLGVAAFGTGSVIALLGLRREPGRSIYWATTAGILAGLAGGSKYLALASVVVPVTLVLAIIVIVNSRSGAPWRRAAWASVAFVAGTAVFIAPWLARNAVQTGNPVHPYFSTVFQHDGGDAAGADQGVATGIGNFELNTGKLGIGLTLGTFAPRGQSGHIGPVHLLLLPLIVLWVWRHRREPNVPVVFAVFAAGMIAWALGPPLGRYLLPSIALAAALGGAAWAELAGRFAAPVRNGAALVLAAILLANLNPVRGEYLFRQLECFLGAVGTEEYLSANCTQLEAFRTAGEKLPAEATVLLVGEPRPYAFDRDLVVEDQFTTPLIVELAETTSNADEIAAKLRDLGVTHLLRNSAEANRIASAAGRSAYLECSNAVAQKRLELFFAQRTRMVARGDWWEIRAIDPE